MTFYILGRFCCVVFPPLKIPSSSFLAFFWKRQGKGKPSKKQGIFQGESSTRSLKAPLKVPAKGPLNPPLKGPLKVPRKAPLKAPLKVSLKVRPPSCTPYCALEGAPLITLPLALPRMGSWVFLRGALKGTLRDLVVLPQWNFLYRTPQNPGKCKTLKKGKEFLAKETSKAIQKSKEKKIRVPGTIRNARITTPEGQRHTNWWALIFYPLRDAIFELKKT